MGGACDFVVIRRILKKRAMYIGFDEVEAEDVVQIVLLKLLKYPPKPAEQMEDDDYIKIGYHSLHQVQQDRKQQKDMEIRRFGYRATPTSDGYDAMNYIPDRIHRSQEFDWEEFDLPRTPATEALARLILDNPSAHHIKLIGRLSQAHRKELKNLRRAKKC